MFMRPSHEPTFTWHTRTLPWCLEAVRPLEKIMLYVCAAGWHDRGFGRA